MGIQSLGVGSGLALDDLVTQLVQAERGPKEERLNQREEELDAVISGLGSLTSKVTEFQDAVDELRNDFNLNSRTPEITHSNQADLAEGDDGAFTLEASNSAVEGDYEIAVEQLAQGSVYRVADGTYSGVSTTDAIYTGGVDATVDFSFVSSSDTFSITVQDQFSLQDYVNAINNASGNVQSDGSTPLVTATLLDTGTAQGPKIIFQSNLTGAGDDLIIRNVSDEAELVALTTQSNGGVDQGLRTNTLDDAPVDSRDALAYVNNIQVQSSSNTFENVIPNVSFEALEVSPLDGTSPTGFANSSVTIGNDEQGLKSKIKDFIDNYNSLNAEIGRLTRFGESELEEDGALAGDFLVRGIQSGLSNLLSNTVSGNALQSIFQIGVSFDDDGNLELTTVDEFGTGSGEDQLDDALESNFDDVADLFTNSTNGFGSQIYDFLREYTRFGGILRTRTDGAEQEKEALATEREAFELRILNFEQIQRQKFIALDQTVASLNSTGQALLASLQPIS